MFCHYVCDRLVTLNKKLKFDRFAIFYYTIKRLIILYNFVFSDLGTVFKFQGGKYIGLMTSFRCQRLFLKRTDLKQFS